MSQAGIINIAGSGTSVLEMLTGNSGSAVPPTNNNINTVGTGSITIAGNPGTSTLTTELTGLTNHNVLVGAGSATITNVSPSATSGIPLVSGGSSADPSFTTAVVAGGGSGATSFTAYMPIVGGTTTTAPLQSVSTGTAGYSLTYVSSSAIPTWQQNFGGQTWTTSSSTTITLASNTSYVLTGGSAIALTLPASPVIYDAIKIIVNTAQIATISVPATQTLRFGQTAYTTSLANSLQGDTITMRCTTTGTAAVWIVETGVGNWTGS